MGKLVAIGGGSLDVVAIDREIVRLSGKTRPRVLFVPTATEDSPEYCETFQSLYAGRLSCPVDELLLYRDRPTAAAMKRMMQTADVIYVGGGNTLRMMRFWQRLGVDRLLRQAWKRGTVLCGVSAGAICWLNWGCSDSRSFSGKPDWEYIRVHGLNLLDIAGCPHYHGEKRERAFEEMVRRQHRTAIALDDHTAFEYVDGRYRILAAKDDAKAYRLFRTGADVTTERLEAATTWNDFASLHPNQPARGGNSGR